MAGTGSDDDDADDVDDDNAADDDDDVDVDAYLYLTGADDRLIGRDGIRRSQPSPPLTRSQKSKEIHKANYSNEFLPQDTFEEIIYPRSKM